MRGLHTTWEATRSNRTARLPCHCTAPHGGTVAGQRRPVLPATAHTGRAVYTPRFPSSYSSFCCAAAPRRPFPGLPGWSPWVRYRRNAYQNSALRWPARRGREFRSRGVPHRYPLPQKLPGCHGISFVCQTGRRRSLPVSRPGRRWPRFSHSGVPNRGG